jgi:hypothetical protein
MRSVVLGLALLAMLGTAASAKPKIAILGLEVVGNLDPDQVKLARQLTNALRERASAGTGPYDLAPNSDKELVDEKLMNNCGTEALTCMSPIGMSMKADYLMFGKMEKVDKGFHVTIKLIRVATKMPLPTFSEIVPAADVKNDPKGVAKRAYAMMTATDEGTVTIRVARVDRATVYIDDAPVGTTSSGVLTISVPEGQHRLAVVATEKGWKRHEEILQINAGDQRNIPVELVRATRRGDPPPRSDALAPPGGELSHTTEGATSDTGSRAGWRMVLAVSLVVGLGGGGTWIYGFREIKGAEAKRDELCPMPNMDGSCMLPDEKLPELNGANERGERGRLLTKVGIPVTVAGGVFGMLSLYMGFFTSPEKKAIGGHGARPRRNLLVAPVVSPTGGGATLRFDW